MRIKSPLLILLIILFYSCVKTEDKLIETPVADNPVEEPVQVDEKKPELTVVGFTDIIETKTTVSVSIVDESTVETKVMHNGEEITASTEKQFDVLINPYGMPVGSTDFTVVSTDANGNEISETFSIEIKHLLMTYGYSVQEGENSFQRWIFFNDMAGNELAALKPTAGNTKIYTDELIEDEKIMYSLVNYHSQDFTDGGYRNLYVGTYEIPLGGSRIESTWDIWVGHENTVDVVLKDVPFVDYAPQYWAYGSKYNASSYDGDAEQTTLSVSHSGSGPIFLRTNSWGGTPVFNGKKENYKYIKLTPEKGDTTIEVEASQLVAAGDNQKIDIPEHDLGSLSFRRSGYDEGTNGTASSYSVYEMSQWNSTEVIDYIDLPIFEEYDNYANNISYSRNGNFFSSGGKNDEIEIEMPNWTLTTEMTNSTVEINADNSEVDYYAVGLYKSDYTTSNSMSYHWNFYIPGAENGTKIVPRLNIPQLISDAIAESFFEITDDMERINSSAINYADYNSYDEIMEWLVFNSISHNNGTKYEQISFPNTSSSGKTNQPNQPWDLDALHRYGLDAKGNVKKRR